MAFPEISPLRVGQRPLKGARGTWFRATQSGLCGMSEPAWLQTNFSVPSCRAMAEGDALKLQNIHATETAV